MSFASSLRALKSRLASRAEGLARLSWTLWGRTMQRSISSWFRFFFDAGRQHRRRSAPWLLLELLEARTLPATSPFFSMPTNLVASQGGTVTVPVSIGHLTDSAGDKGLDAAEVVLTYDPNVFTVSDTDVNPGALLNNPPPGGQWTFTVDTSTLGEVDLSVASSDPSLDVASQAGGVLATIAFHVIPSAPLGKSAIGIVVPNATSANGLTSAATPSTGPHSANGDAAGYTLFASQQVKGVVQVRS